VVCVKTIITLLLLVLPIIDQLIALLNFKIALLSFKFNLLLKMVIAIISDYQNFLAFR